MQSPSDGITTGVRLLGDGVRDELEGFGLVTRVERVQGWTKRRAKGCVKIIKKTLITQPRADLLDHTPCRRKRKFVPMRDDDPDGEPLLQLRVRSRFCKLASSFQIRERVFRGRVCHNLKMNSNFRFNSIFLLNM